MSSTFHWRFIWSVTNASSFVARWFSRGDDYKLFWPDKGEFVRLAAATKSGAVIIPFSAVGIADRSVRLNVECCMSSFSHPGP